MFATFSRQNLASSKAFIATSLLNKLEGFYCFFHLHIWLILYISLISLKLMLTLLCYFEIFKNNEINIQNSKKRKSQLFEINIFKIESHINCIE